MQKLYLAVPTSRGESYPNGGNEQYWMNKIADGVEEMLKGHIEIFRSKADEKGFPLSSSCGLYVNIGSRSAPSEAVGMIKGVGVYCAEPQADCLRAAEIFAERLKEVYPEPELVEVCSNSAFAELPAQVPALTIWLAYHDNPQDEAWLVNSIDEIAWSLSNAAAEAMEVTLAVD